MPSTCHRTSKGYPKTGKSLSSNGASNSGHYDLYLIRKYFVFHLGQEAGVFAGKKNGRTMFINTPHYKFLDVMNYVSPGTSYDKWVKTYGATQTKSWLPYEWFDSADKLDHKGLPPYRCWFSKLINNFVLFPTEYDDCLRVFKGHGNLWELVGILQQSRRFTFS